MTYAVEMSGIDFAYGAVPVLSAVDLRVEDGEFLGIVGPNGGGKSTLLKLILGLIEPQSGNVRVLERDPRRAARMIGYVPQYPSFPRDFPITVAEVVQLGRLGAYRAGGWRALFWPSGPGPDDITAARRALQQVEADNIANRNIGSLSGGQLQRVLLARALASEPRLLILDEPTANIDQRLENDLFDLLRALNDRMTILVVSHDVAFISGYVSRVACVNRTLVCHRTEAIDGQVIQNLYGDPVRLVAHAH